MVSANANCIWIGTGLELTNAMLSDNCASDVALIASLTSNIPVPSTPGNLNGYPFPLGNTAVTYTVSDGLNTGICNFNVIVSDNTNPVLSCPSDVTFYLDPITCDYTITLADAALVDALATDNCPGLGASMHNYNLGGTSLVGETFPFGTTLVIWNVTDGAGNNSDCPAFNVVVADNTPPAVVFLPFDGSSGVYGVFPPIFAAGCEASVTIEQPNLFITDFSIPPFPYIGPNYIATDCNGILTTCLLVKLTS